MEEVVEVSMKLNVLKGLGIHLGIEGERERERCHPYTLLSSIKAFNFYMLVA